MYLLMGEQSFRMKIGDKAFTNHNLTLVSGGVMAILHPDIYLKYDIGFSEDGFVFNACTEFHSNIKFESEKG